MKKIKILIALILSLSLIACSSERKIEKIIINNKVEVENELFNEFLTKGFKETMEADYLSMHYTVKDYEAFGIEKPSPVFEPVTLEWYTEAVEDAKEILEELKTFDKATLTNEQLINYYVYEKSLEDYIVINSYPMFDNYFDPARGIVDNLITNFIEFEFRSEEDFTDYLSLLESVPAFVDSAIDFTKMQAGEGYYMNDDAVDYVIEAIDRFVSKVDDNELIIDFNNEVDKFRLDEKLKTEYKNKNKALIVEQYIPSYIKVKEVLNSLRGSRKIEGGLANYENGKVYYESLIKNKASNKLSLEEQIKLAETAIKNEIAMIRKIAKDEPDVFDSDFYGKVQFEDAKSIIEFALSNMDKHYPEGPKVEYEISYLDPSVANDSTLAYYLSPPFDDITRNIIKVNPNAEQEHLELYTTVTHEGFPGHLYQITYFMSSNPHPIRYTIDHIGYIEGWAMYTETMSSYDLDLTYGEASLYNIDIKLNYILSAAVDIGVNGLGWTLKDSEKWLAKFNMDEYAESLYEQAIMMPNVLVPYGMGILQFYNLRHHAEEKLAKNFDEIAFNKVLLDNGDRYFELVSEDVEKFIEANK